MAVNGYPSILCFLSLLCTTAWSQTTTANTSSLTVYQSGVDFAPSPLPAPYARSKGEEIFAAFQNLGRSTVFNLSQTVDFGTYVEAEGIVRVGQDRYFVSHNDYTANTTKYPMITNGTDRTPGAGFGLLAVVDGTGNKIAQVNLSAPGALEYHNGGIDYDGRYIWCNIAQYRPNSTFCLVRVDPLTLDFTYIARFADHAGGPIHDTYTDNVVNLNWGSRNATVWKLDGSSTPLPGFTAPDFVLRNPSFFVDYQDCKFLGRIQAYGNKPCAFCSGVATLGTFNLGGLAIIDLETLSPIFEIPFANMTATGWPYTQNPSDIDMIDGHLRFWFFPEQHCDNCTLYVVDALTASPFEFGGGPQ